MLAVRKAAVSGIFYPSNKSELSHLLESFLISENNTDFPKALIVPHAGYMYSGSTAGIGYSTIKGNKPTSILLMGPAHRVFVKGLAIPNWDQFETPLGKVDLNQEALQKIRQFPFVEINNEAHKNEHCIELQLPFLQKLFSNFRIIPILAGDVEPEQIALLLEAIETDVDLIIISSDLSHYNSYEKATELDRAISDSIEKLDPSSIDSEQACGYKPVKGLLLYAKKKGMTSKTLALKNSGDTSGDKSSVVGYGSFAFFNVSA
jgi:hypothetical protein